MWEELRAQIDTTVRNAELERKTREAEARAYRDFSLTSLPRTSGQAPRDVPKQWRVRLPAAKARPVL